MTIATPLPTSPPAWGGRLLLAPGEVLYVGPGAVADEHAHHAVQFVWASQGEVSLSWRESARGVRTLRARAALIPAGVPHAFEAAGQTIVLMLVERHGRRGMALEQRARECLGRDVAGELGGIAFPSVEWGTPAMALWSEQLMTSLTALSAPPKPLSHAVVAAMAGIEQSIGGVPRLSDVAARTSLSASRLGHRFSAEIGIPFRRFVLWVRIKRVVDEVRRGATLTEAAMRAGFSDSAHLSRSFRAMFGASPSALLAHMELSGSLWPELAKAQH